MRRKRMGASTRRKRRMGESTRKLNDMWAPFVSGCCRNFGGFGLGASAKVDVK
jgi:hypothetical protein